MNNEANIRFQKEVDRTFQANKRTLQEYLNTGLSSLIAGVVIVYFSHQGWFCAMGIACVVIGIVISVIGAARFRNMRQRICLIQVQHGVDAKLKRD